MRQAHSLCFWRPCVVKWPHYIKTKTCSSLERPLWNIGVPQIWCGFSWSDVQDSLPPADKCQIVHYNCLRHYNAPVPDQWHETPDCDSSSQPQLPHLTVLPGALTFKPSKSAATKSYNMPGRRRAPSLPPWICQPQPQSHSLLSHASWTWTQCLTALPSGQGKIRQSHT